MNNPMQQMMQKMLAAMADVVRANSTGATASHE